ncbi:MAG: hypothetical protein MUP36_03395 [Demequinaceae bacterium]|nr:hypothetical protein [Demequinaceae bacterium]
MRVFLGIFLIFHGMVHAIYIGQALRWFELRPGMPWPTGAWTLASLSDGTLRAFASVTIGVASLGLMLGGAGMLFKWGWADWVAIGGAVLASVVHVLLWNGKWAEAADHGGYGVIINVAAIVAILVVRS